MQEIDLKYLREVVKVARSARENGNHPFGAILVGPDQEILLRVENTVSTEKDVTGHAETNLVREASKILFSGIFSYLHNVCKYRALRDVRWRGVLVEYSACRFRAKRGQALSACG